jgi:hypothetical protein
LKLLLYTYIIVLIMKSVISFTSSILQLDKDWVTRMTMAMIVLSIIWGALDIIDALMVRLHGV